MFQMNRFCIFVFVCVLTADWCVEGIQWTNPNLQDGAILSACVGSDVKITWTFSLPFDEHLLDVEWRFAPFGSQTENVIATAVNGHFFTDSITRFTLEPIGNGGIRVLGVTSQDSGTYSVHVNVNQNGSVVSYVHSVNLTVSNELLTTDGRLHASLVQNDTFVDSTQEHHVILSCGHFSLFWADKIHVIWETPDRRRLPSTGQAHGEFTLAVPNPVMSGGYTCMVDTATSPSLCINNHSTVLHGASVLVDEQQAKVMLLESQLKQLTAQNIQLRHDVYQLQRNNSCGVVDMNQICAQVHQRENSTGVRLVNGSSCLEGRVEVFYGGQWGTVCDDEFVTSQAPNPQAEVVCRQLGLPTVGAIAWPNAHFGAGLANTTILMDDVRCVGSESALQDCRQRGWGTSNCDHIEDVGVTCGNLTGTKVPGLPRLDCSCDFETGRFCNWTNVLSDQFDWTILAGPTSSTDTGPSADHTLGTGSGHYAYIEASSPRVVNDAARLESPVLDPHQQYCLSFWYHMYGSQLGSINVRISANGITGSPVKTLTGPSEDQWKHAFVTINEQSTSFQIIIEGVVGSGYYGDAAIDDITVTEDICL